MTSSAGEGSPATEPRNRFDVVIIGAGITGLYQLHVLRQLGVSVRVLEAGGGIGGTWYFNRYPGCRLDSESYTYQYVFDEELLAETVWKERFATQPDIERYINDFADRFDLRRDVQLNTRIESMVYDESTRTWTLHTDRGETVHAWVVITATGILSAPNFPPLPGADRFRGELLHTGLWPHDEVRFEGKRVAVIGTGASGVQIIPVIAAAADHLTVFQRTPNWAVPLNNAPLSDDDMARIRADYPAMIARLNSTSNGFLHDWDPTPFFDVPEDERNAKFEEWYNGPGFSKWFGIYRAIAVDPVAAEIYGNFIADKIRARVKDPAVAELLIPADHPFGAKRVPCETNYYEAYNRDNVELISLSKNPILEYTETGLLTQDGPRDFDMIILATGFDAFTGALSRIDIRGVGGLTLREKWASGPKTYMGLQVSGFPNLLINGGPHGKGGIGNSPRCSEPVIHWMAGLLEHMRANGFTRVEADEGSEKEWTDQVNDMVAGSIASKIRSYSFGDNVPGKPHVYFAYAGSLPDFVERLESTAASGYPGFVLS